MNPTDRCTRCGHRRCDHAHDGAKGWPEHCDMPECVCPRFEDDDDD